MGTDHPQIPVAVHRHHADAHHGGHNGDAAVPGKGLHLFPGAGQHDAAAAADQGPLGFLNGLYGLLNLQSMALGPGLVADNLGFFRIGKGFDFPLLHVHRHINEYRAGAAGGGDVEGFFENPGQLPGVLYQIAVLGEGFTGAGDVGLLEYIPAQQFGVHLAGNGHHGNGIHIGGGNAGDEVGGPGAGGGDANTGLAAAPGVAAGHVGGVLLFPHQNMADGRLIQIVIKGADHRSGISKGDLYTFCLQAFHHNFGSAYQKASPSFF